LELKLDGVFLAIGHNPTTSFLGKALELDGSATLLQRKHKTSADGVFVAGDVAIQGTDKQSPQLEWAAWRHWTAKNG